MPIGILGGTLIASGLKALFDIFATKGANRYNSPKAQLERLREAGLPLSYMYGGRVNQQSSVPQLSISPTLGQLEKLQGAKLAEDAQLTDTQQEDLAKDIQAKDLIQPGETLNNRALKFQSEANRAKAESFIKQHEQEIKNIEMKVEQIAFKKGIPQAIREQELKKIKQQVVNLLDQAGLMKQLYRIRGLDELLNNALVNDIRSMPQWLDGLLKIILIATRRSSH